MIYVRTRLAVGETLSFIVVNYRGYDDMEAGSTQCLGKMSGQDFLEVLFPLLKKISRVFIPSK